MAWTFVAVGMVLLFLGSEGLLRGGIGISRAAGLSPILTGLLVVALATGAPELSIALQIVSRAPDIVIATVIGGNIVNLLLILGLAALVTQLPTPPKIVFRDGIAAILACAALAFAVTDGKLTRIEGFGLLGSFVVYAVVAVATDWHRAAQDSEARAQCRGASDSAATSLFFVFLGIVGVVLGARCLIDGALTVAAHYRISDTMTGLTIIAGAAALPELFLIIVMARRDRSFVTAGHLLGASIFNVLVVVGLAATIEPFAISAAARSPDIYIMLAAAVVVFPLMIHAWRLSRPNGALLIALYMAYGAFLANRLGYLPTHLPNWR